MCLPQYPQCNTVSFIRKHGSHTRCTVYINCRSSCSFLLLVQLLFINLLTDSLPAIAIGMEPVDDSLLDEKKKPRDRFTWNTHKIIPFQDYQSGISYCNRSNDSLLSGTTTIPFLHKVHKQQPILHLQ